MRKILHGCDHEVVSMKINFVPAGNILNSINQSTNSINSSIERLSTGKRLNSAKDSPAEIGIAAKLKSAIESHKRLMQNLQDAISLFQTADYSISGSSGLLDILNSIREKIFAAGNGTLTSSDINLIQNEVNDLIDEIDNITTSIEFNTKKLLNGDYLATITTSSADVNAYALDRLNTTTLELTNITGATYNTYQIGPYDPSTLTSEGTFVIQGNDNAISINWSASDTLEDIANRINSYNDVAKAEVVTSGTDTYLQITSLEKGVAGRISLSDLSGNFISSQGATETDAGNDASLTYNGTTYTSQTGEFTDVYDNLVIKVADNANVPNATISITDKTVSIPLDIEGGTQLDVYIKDLTPESLGLKDVNGDYAIDLSTSNGRTKALSLIDNIISRVTSEASRIGSMENTLNYQIDQITNYNLNLSSSYSNIMDTDIAEEMAKLTTQQLQLQTSTLMLTKRNELISSVINLLGINTNK
ncbi:flagellin [Deferribacter thermophilus]